MQRPCAQPQAKAASAACSQTRGAHAQPQSLTFRAAMGGTSPAAALQAAGLSQHSAAAARRASQSCRAASAAPAGTQPPAFSSSGQPPMKVVIAGGGIGGLVLAVGLLKKGFEVQVLERDLTAIRGEGKYRGPIQVRCLWCGERASRRVRPLPAAGCPPGGSWRFHTFKCGSSRPAWHVLHVLQRRLAASMQSTRSNSCHALAPGPLTLCPLPFPLLNRRHRRCRSRAMPWARSRRLTRASRSACTRRAASPATASTASATASPATGTSSLTPSTPPSTWACPSPASSPASPCRQDSQAPPSQPPSQPDSQLPSQTDSQLCGHVGLLQQAAGAHKSSSPLPHF